MQESGQSNEFFDSQLKEDNSLAGSLMSPDPKTDDSNSPNKMTKHTKFNSFVNLSGNQLTRSELYLDRMLELGFTNRENVTKTNFNKSNTIRNTNKSGNNILAVKSKIS